MSNLAEIRRDEKTIELVNDKLLVDFLKFTGNAGKLTEAETKHFISIAKTFNLNPLKREIHISVYGDGNYRNLSIVTGYETYIKRAERTGQLDGWEVTTEGSGDDLVARITIYRKDRSRPFIHEVHYSEYCQRKKDGSVNKFWKEKPITMLKKVAISQGFRLCFCDDLDGMPYTSDEMPMEEKDISPIQEPIEAQSNDKPQQKPPLEKLTETLVTIYQARDIARLEEKTLPSWEGFKGKIPVESFEEGLRRIKKTLSALKGEIAEVVFHEGQ